MHVFWSQLRKPRSWVSALCLCAVWLVVVELSSSAHTGLSDGNNKPQDWPCFLGPTHDGKSTATGLPTHWPADGPSVLWGVDVGEGYAAPTCANGKLYLYDRMCDQARLRCLHARSGKTLWVRHFPTQYVDAYGYDGGPRCCPVVDEDRVYLHSAEGMLYCVAAQDGKTLWKVDTFTQYGVVPNFFGVGSTPVVHGEDLIVMVGGSPKGSVQIPFENLKGNGTGVVIFDKQTGKEKHRLSDELASYASPLVVQWDKQDLGLIFTRSGLLVIEPRAGKNRFFFPWRARLVESVNASNPVVYGNQVFITESYQLGGALLQWEQGQLRVLWSDQDKGRDKSLGCHWMTPVLHEGHLYGCHGRQSNEAELRCVEWATGKLKWRQKGLGRTSLLYVDGHFVVLTEEGQIILIRAQADRYNVVATWEPKRDAALGGQYWLDYPCWAAPILADGILYLRGKKHLIAMELLTSTGKK